ncbi:magnesium-protoporphyrin O-methyltransferase [Trifolium pratense]|uniref:Magnesium-protoporphyrin O-methyltransferase n=1 Tax=Trifolium pratense TaxID=57577 RepID=A0A2K3PKH6_TRIPR|nr:magnesium protoporphyrin IX methyltransferase, chloroplastic [Trifolium pratense]PNY15765.1 magnesium-protoporphyrin O-methyltransferase [Trifolium pratense]
MAFSSSLWSSLFIPNPNKTNRFSTFSPSPSPANHKLSTTTFAIPPLSTATAADVSGAIDGTTIAVLSGGFVAGLTALVSLTDPERRRREQAEEVGGDDKKVVKEYFNNDGFQRWKKIYGDTDDVNRVQRDIRVGHAKTVENALMMLKEEGSLQGVTICDAGCGTGSLSIPLAKEGAVVCASDISAAMVAEAEKQAKEQLVPSALPKFVVSDLESLDGLYDAVVCLDVMIHYPQSKADGMIAHLASLAEKRLILSFAPKTFYYDALKRVGELFPGPSKATRAYLHSEADVENALRKVGWTIKKRGLIATQFYFAKLIEAVPM